MEGPAVRETERHHLGAEPVRLGPAYAIRRGSHAFVCLRSGLGLTLHRHGGISISGVLGGGVSLLWGEANRRVWRNARDVRAFGFYRRHGERPTVYSGDARDIDWPRLDETLPRLGAFVGSDF